MVHRVVSPLSGADRQAMIDDKILYADLSYKVVGCAMKVRDELGYGFLERVYENAMMVMFREIGIAARQQVPLKVFFHGFVVGDYIVDILVDDKIVLELKTGEGINNNHKTQMLHYLAATKMRLAMILNFGKHKVDVERLIV